MTQLWTEKYRPQNINDYVWRDESQKAMAEKWIKDGVLPSILLAGTAGIGKCLHQDELLDVEFDISKMSEEQIQRLNKILKK